MSLKWKHLAAGVFAFTLAATVYIINRDLGNSHARAWPISAFLLGIAYLPFAMVWALKDMWRARWHELERKFPSRLASEAHANHEVFSIPINAMAPLCGHLFTPSLEKSPAKGCVLLLHGYSDTQAMLGYLGDFLLRSGYCVVTYDSPGTGESRHAGHKNDFLAKIYRDFPHIVDFLQHHTLTSSLPLIVVGFSIGASAALIGGVRNSHAKVIVAVSALADHMRNMPWTWNPFHARFWLSIRYFFLDIRHHVSPRVNAHISPLLALTALRQSLPLDQWARLVTNRVFLIHAADDRTILASNFLANKSALGLPASQAILLSSGGHAYLRAELLLASVLLRIFDTALVS